jgi:hypothetical protein
MAEPTTSRRKMLQVDFFTHAHRLSTQVNVYVRPLSDQLNDPRVSWIELDSAYISRIEKPGEIIADYALSTLRKDRILFAMIAGSTEGAVKKIVQVSGFYTKRLHQVLVATPSFEITGDIELTGKIDLHTLLVTTVERFMPIQNATATVSLFPQTRFSAELMLVNKDEFDAFCVDEKGRPAPQG